jgi:GntR family transcriptional regulator of arabinose operon
MAEGTAPVSSGNKADVLVRTLIEQILAGQFEPDERIPSERQLATDYNVNRGTMHKVLAELSARGWVYRRPGVGTFVRPREAAGRRQTPVFVQVCMTGTASPSAVRAQQYEMLRGVEAGCRRRGARLVLADGTRALPLDTVLPQTFEAGLILMPASRTEHEQCTARPLASRPVVWIGTPPERLPEGHACVQVDLKMAARLAVEHFRRFGHRHIALAMLEDRVGCDALAEAFREAMAPRIAQPLIWREPDVRTLTSQVCSHLMYAGGMSATAVFCCDDFVAARVAEAAARVGRRVPHGLSLIGLGNLAGRFGDTGMPADLLTTITYDEALVGEMAADALLGDAQPCGTQTIPVDLIRRKSVAPPPPTGR